MDRLPRRRRIYDQFTEDDEQYAGNYPLSKQILDYYYKFDGKERNLDRYLKLNRSLGSKSSSDGSLDQHSGRPRCVHFRRERAKSMDCLERGQREEKVVQTESTSYQSCVEEVDGRPEEEDENNSEGMAEESSSSELIVATKQQGEEMKQLRKVSVRKDHGRKSYQISVESKVEIAFPTQFYQAMTAGMVIPGPPAEQPEEEKSVVSQGKPEEQESEQTIEVVQEKGPDPFIIAASSSPPPNNNRSTVLDSAVSPASSVASTKQRLEWDSLGDVGYQRSQSEPRVDGRMFGRNSSSSALKESKSVSEPPTLTSSKSTGAIPKRKVNPPPPLPEVKEPTATAKEKWREVLKKSKTNNSSLLDSNSKLETPSSKITFDANCSTFAQSTPVVSPVVVEQATKREEKSSQTSDIGTVSRSIQAIFQHMDKTTSMSSNDESTAGSFEYVKGSQVDRASSAINAKTSSSTTSMDEESRRMNTIRVRKEISNFLGNVTGKDPNAEADVQQAVDYIAMLFDSRSIDRKFKRKLVEKIIGKLLRGKSVNEAKPVAKVESVVESSRGCCSTEVSSREIPSSRDSTRLSDIKQSELLKDWLKPMTNSEIAYERRREKERKDSEAVTEGGGGENKRVEGKQETPREAKKPHESEDFAAQDSSEDEQAQLRNKDKEKDLQLRCIAREIEYLERIKKLIEVGRMNLNNDTQTNWEALQGKSYRQPPPVRTRSESRTTAEESLSMASTRASSLSKKSTSSDWDSHKNLQIVIKDRRKLNTPPPLNEGGAGFAELKEFVDRRTKEFAERYEKRTCNSGTDQSKHYSEPRSVSSTSGAHKHRPTLVNASTSVNSCEFSCTGPEFAKTVSTIESSASRLAAISNKKANKINDSKETVTSMSFSAPITRRPNTDRPVPPPRTTSSRLGRGVQQQQHQQQQQSLCPESIAYTIVLNPKETTPPAIATGRTEATSNIGDLLYDQVSGAGASNSARVKICETGRFRLEDYLKLNRPDFIEQAEERKEGVETARRRRALKNHEKENLLMSPNLPRSRISKLLEATLREAQEEKKEKLSSNASVIYKQQARRKYKKLPEVVRKDETEKQNAYKKNTKILAEVFNKNLQRIVLRGEMNIPHSRRVLSTL